MPRKFRPDRRYRLFDWRTAILEDAQLQPNTRLVGLVLSLHMNKAGESCFPGLELLKTQTGLGRSAVSEHIRKLTARGWVDRRPNPGRSKATEYVATFPPDVVEEIAKMAAQAVEKGPPGRTVSEAKGSAGADASEGPKGAAGADRSGKGPPARTPIEDERTGGELHSPAEKNGSTSWMAPIADVHLETMGGPLNCGRWARTFSDLRTFVIAEHALANEPEVAMSTIVVHVRNYAQHMRDTGRAEFLDYNKMAASFGQWATPHRDPKRPTQNLEGKDYGGGRFSRPRGTRE